MVFLDVTPSNADTPFPSEPAMTHLQKLNHLLRRSDAQGFVLFYLEGCGPCNRTRPEWHKLKQVLPGEFKSRGDVYIVSVDQELSPKLAPHGAELVGFPTIRAIRNAGTHVTDYQEASIPVKDRSADSFAKWITQESPAAGKRASHGATSAAAMHGGGVQSWLLGRANASPANCHTELRRLGPFRWRTTQCRSGTAAHTIRRHHAHRRGRHGRPRGHWHRRAHTARRRGPRARRGAHSHRRRHHHAAHRRHTYGHRR